MQICARQEQWVSWMIKGLPSSGINTNHAVEILISNDLSYLKPPLHQITAHLDALKFAKFLRPLTMLP